MEVKSVPSLEYLHVRMTRRQKNRLRRALCYCLERQAGTRLELAVVCESGQVLIFDDVLS